MNTLKKLCTLTVFSLFLVGCGSSKTMVFEPLEVQNTPKKIYLEQDKNTTEVPEEVAKKFEEVLSQKLFKENTFQQGRDIALQYRFLQCNEGSQFKRWMLGGLGNAGEGSVTIEVRFIDNTQNGKEIGKIHTEGKIGSGFFGGSFNNAVESAAEEVTKYMKLSFNKA